MKNLSISLNISKFWCLTFSRIFSETKQISEFVKENSNLAWGGRTEMEVRSQALLIFNFICLIQRFEQVLWEAIGFRDFEFLRTPERARERFTSEKVKFEGLYLQYMQSEGGKRGCWAFRIRFVLWAGSWIKRSPIVLFRSETRLVE